MFTLLQEMLDLSEAKKYVAREDHDAKDGSWYVDNPDESLYQKGLSEYDAKKLAARMNAHLSEAGRVFTRPGTAAKRGAPEEPARAFDKRPKNRSVIKKLEKEANGKYFAVEFSDEGDSIQVLIMKPGIEDADYYGINVVFKPSGKVECVSADPISDKQIKADKAKIIETARMALEQDHDLPSIYDGLGGRESKRGKGKLSFDVRESLNEGMKADLDKAAEFLEDHGFTIAKRDKNSVTGSKARRRDVRIAKDDEKGDGWRMTVKVGGKFANDGEATRNGEERWLGVCMDKNLDAFLDDASTFKKYL